MEGAPRGWMLNPHLQTSRTAPAGWTGQWLRSLGQGENTVSQVSQNSLAPQGGIPAPSSPCISLPECWVCIGKKQLHLQQLHIPCSKDRNTPGGTSLGRDSPDHPLEATSYRCRCLFQCAGKDCKPAGTALPPLPLEVPGTGPAAGSAAALQAGDAQPSTLQPHTHRSH